MYEKDGIYFKLKYLKIVKRRNYFLRCTNKFGTFLYKIESKFVNFQTIHCIVVAWNNTDILFM